MIKANFQWLYSILRLVIDSIIKKKQIFARIKYWLRNTNIQAAFIAIIGSVIIAVFQTYSLSKNQSLFYIIAHSTMSQAQALKTAVLINRKGHAAKVFLTKSSYYAVAFGPYSGDQATAIKKQYLEKRIIRHDSFITAQGILDEVNIPTITDHSNYYIVVNSTKKKEESIKLLRSLIKKGFFPNVYLSPNLYFATAFGPFSPEEAGIYKDYLVNSQIIKKNLFIISSDSMHEEITYSSLDPSDLRFHIIVYSTREKDAAIKMAESLIAEGFKSEVFFTYSSFFAVTIGEYEFDRANEVRSKAIQNGFIKSDSFLGGRKNFFNKVFPHS